MPPRVSRRPYHVLTACHSIPRNVAAKPSSIVEQSLEFPRHESSASSIRLRSLRFSGLYPGFLSVELRRHNM